MSVEAAPATCSTCRARLGDGAETCRTCGSPVEPTDYLPRSAAARRGLIFGLVPFGVNFVVNIAQRALMPVFEGSPVGSTPYSASWIISLVLLGFNFLVNIGFIVAAYHFSVLGWRETRDGSVLGRGSANAGIVFASLASASVVYGIVSTGVQFAAAMGS